MFGFREDAAILHACLMSGLPLRNRMNPKYLCLVFALLALSVPIHSVSTAAPIQTLALADPARDIPDLARMYDEDQADRTPKAGQAIDWNVVTPRDKAREAKVKEYYQAGLLQSGHDHQRATDAQQRQR